MSERAIGPVIKVGGSARMLSDGNALRAIARLITGDDDCSHEEAMAAAYDFNFGGDDNRVGWVITAMVRAAPESDRDYIIRVALATDVLRTAPRTAH